MTRNEIITLSIAGASLVLNIVLGVITYQQSEKKQDLARTLEIEKSKPLIIQDRVILEGTALKAMTMMDHSANLIENIPHPRFVENEVGAELYAIIEKNDAVRLLEGVVTEFITIRNSSDNIASNVNLTDSLGEKLLLGDASPGVTFFVPVSFTQRQPYKEVKTPSDYQKLEYQFLAIGKLSTTHQEIRKKTTRSWIPSFNSMYGVGRALITDKNNHLIKEAQRE